MTSRPFACPHGRLPLPTTAFELLAARIRTTMLLMGAGSYADLGLDDMRAPRLHRWQ
ncbi:hypothetical protein [Kocuria sp. cx-455]|uniref:hypothetical protein n=1 Tax=Kocuria sp. cx-455 TaxID=2771377 RepID=UPI003D7438EC